MQPLVITLVGRDRPGIVETISAIALNNQGNWQASSLSRMAGQFAGIIEVMLPENAYDKFSAQLHAIPELTVHIEKGNEQTLADLSQRLTLTVVGNDRPGIVAKLTKLMNQHGVNVLQMESGCESAPNWGSPLFRVQFQLSLPETLEKDTLIDELESIADDLTVDVETD